MTDRSRAATCAPKPRVESPEKIAKWMKPFLAELAITSNVTASAKQAKITTSKAYEARRNDAAFNRRWQEALCEGYDNLEMELLCRLRTGEIKRGTGSTKGVRSFDNGNAFRLLAAHRESVLRQHAFRANEDADEVILRINAKFEVLRERLGVQAPLLNREGAAIDL